MHQRLAEQSPLKSLNYFAIHDALQSIPIRELADVDDGAILEFIKVTARSRRRRPVADLTDRELRFLALTDAVVHGESNWLSLWKTPSDYEAFAQSMLPQLHALLGQRIDGLTLQMAGTSPAGRFQLLYKIEMLNETRRLLDDLRYYSEDAGVDFGILLSRLMVRILSPNSTARSSTAQREDRLGRVLASFSPPAFRELAGSTWTLAFEGEIPNSPPEFTTRVYNGRSYRSIEDVSALVAGLRFVEGRRPRFYCYLSAHEFDRKMLSEILSQNDGELSHGFALALIEALESWATPPSEDDMSI